MKASATFLFLAVAFHAQVPLETLRDQAKLRVGALQGQFQNELLFALRVFAEVPADDDHPSLVKARAQLKPWVPAFAEQTFLTASTHQHPLVRQRLLELLTSTEARDALPSARKLIPTGTGTARVAAIQLLAALGTQSDGALLAAALSGPPAPQSNECAAILRALAALKSAEAPALLKAHCTHAAPEVRLAALESIARLHAQPKEDLALLARAIQDDADTTVRVGALAALSQFGENHDALRVLHDHVKGPDAPLAEAALRALEKIANKDTSKSYLFEAVGGTLSLSFRERCARLLCKLGDPRGARLLAKGSRDAALAQPRDADLQLAAGEQLKALGAYADAVDFFKKALDLLSRAQKYRARVPWARTLALQGRFDDAWDKLKDDYKSLIGFVDDPDFSEMRRDPKWAKLFSSDGN
jgi:tetratricopeptide (TPR) repeat protein